MTESSRSRSPKNTRAGLLSYTLVPSSFGSLGIVWQETETGPKVNRVFLPKDKKPAIAILRTTFPRAELKSCPAIKELNERIQTFLDGYDILFSLDLIALERCTEFQRSVLLAEYKIPRGWMSTYERIARYLGKPRGERAVGRVLSSNPFPIIIPCHRALKSNGELGGFQGGPKMKKALLEMEGIEFSSKGIILTERFCL